ncbi:right-handed parallel beta-helix repeat-containing protein [Laspinema olomoucense]|uniref:Right-handed parallel beta-helix repeat-containing protein n=1 Tax=Laspinema olomoucense D3b TaxID=2953688 RepID=A0ABT2NA50_9CYAN|nr:right-handed parallel beta-helix repeat-containing protein [Laspinema sp. D3b]MCT7979442.1 right-handed parallel beta-helix repeat-containing protein [Laspinema sp. D3b]
MIKVKRRKFFSGLLGLMGVTGAMVQGHQTTAQVRREIEVSNPEAFFRNIGSNRTLKFISPHYNLSELSPELNWANAFMEEDFDGYGLVISGVENLSLVGVNPTASLISLEAAYPNVITFRNCRNITIANIEAGHWPKKSFCSGSVFSFVDCDNIILDQCILFGCGIYGILAQNSSNFQVKGSTIKECTYGIMALQSLTNLLVEDCQFYHNESYDTMLRATNIRGDVRFKTCQFFENSITDYNPNNNYFFWFGDEGSSIVVENSTIVNNEFINLSNDSNRVKLVESTVENNTGGGP